MRINLEASISVDHEHKCQERKRWPAEKKKQQNLVAGVANSELPIQITPTTEHLECTNRIEL